MVKATRGVQGREFIAKRGLNGIPNFANSTHIRYKKMPVAAGDDFHMENIRRPH